MQQLEFLLRGASDVDQVARDALAHLARLPDVNRAGLALTEGAGRRLRFISSDRTGSSDASWCHIDAYDDVPLTAVARTGSSVIGSLDSLAGRYAGMVAAQRELGTCALAAVPLPGSPSVLGGLILYFDADQPFDVAQRGALEGAARWISESVRRVRSHGQGAGYDPSYEQNDHANRASLGLEADPRAASAARRFLRERLETWQIDDDVVDSAQLCLSELVNNVIMHARTSSRLTVSLEERQLTVMLRDLGGAAAGGVHRHQPVEDADEFRVFGRGLTLVDALSDDWGSERDAIGTTAWFAFRLAENGHESFRTG